MERVAFSVLVLLSFMVMWASLTYANRLYAKGTRISKAAARVVICFPFFYFLMLVSMWFMLRSAI
jgi:hypothetical protein